MAEMVIKWTEWQKNGEDGEKMDKMVKNGTDGKKGFPFVPLNYLLSFDFFFTN